jgi:hypothetical protein
VAAALGEEVVSDRVRRWLASIDEGEGREEEPDATDIFVQLDALHDERVERRDSHWCPPGRDPENLERLVRERWARGKR